MLSKHTHIHTMFTSTHPHHTLPHTAFFVLQQGQLHKENIFGDLAYIKVANTSQCHNKSHDHTPAMLNEREGKSGRKTQREERTKEERDAD